MIRFYKKYSKEVKRCNEVKIITKDKDINMDNQSIKKR